MNKLEKQQFQEIITYLIESTKDGTRQWVLSNHTFNSDTVYHMESFSDDGETKFLSIVELDDDTQQYKNHGCMIVYNKGFKSGFQVFGLSESKDILTLEKLVYDKFTSSLIPVISKNSVLGSILGTMGKQYSRNRKLEQLLGEEKEEEKKGFFGLF